MKITKIGKIGFGLLFICIGMLVLESYIIELNNNLYNIPIFIIGSLGTILLFIEREIQWKDADGERISGSP